MPIQSVRYDIPNNQPAPWQQGLMGAIQGGMGYLQGQQQRKLEAQKAFQALLPAMVNQGMIGQAQPGERGAFNVGGNWLKIQQQKPTEWKPTTKEEAIGFEEAKAGMKGPSWGQEQRIAALKSGIKRGHVVIGKEWGVPDELDIKTRVDVLKAIELAGYDPATFQEELNSFPEPKIGEIIEKGGEKYEVIGIDTDGVPLVNKVKKVVTPTSNPTRPNLMRMLNPVDKTRPYPFILNPVTATQQIFGQKPKVPKVPTVFGATPTVGSLKSITRNADGTMKHEFHSQELNKNQFKKPAHIPQDVWDNTTDEQKQEYFDKYGQ